MTADSLKKIAVSLGTAALITLTTWSFQLNATIAVLSDDLDEAIEVIELLHPRTVSAGDLNPVWLTGGSERRQKLEDLRRQAEQQQQAPKPPKGDDDDSGAAGDDDDSATKTEARPLCPEGVAPGDHDCLGRWLDGKLES